MLQSHAWPGNIRELEHEIYQAAALVEEGLHIQTYHFSSQITRGESLMQEVLSERPGWKAAMDSLQRRLIEDALRACGGNVSQATKMLDIDRKTMYYQIKRLNIALSPKRMSEKSP